MKKKKYIANINFLAVIFETFLIEVDTIYLYCIIHLLYMYMYNVLLTIACVSSSSSSSG